MIGEQPPDLVAGEPAPRTVGLRDGGAEPVGIRVVGDAPRRRRRVAGDLEQQVHRTRLLRVRERDRRERAVRLVLLGDHDRRAKPAAANARSIVAPPTPCIAVYATGTARHVGSQPNRRDRVDVRVDPRRVEVRDQRIVLAGEHDRQRIERGRCTRRSAGRRGRRSVTRRPGTPCSRCRPAGCATP